MYTKYNTVKIRLLTILLIVSIIGLVTGCGNTGGAKAKGAGSSSSAVADVLEQKMKAADETSESVAAQPADITEAGSDTQISEQRQSGLNDSAPAPDADEEPKILSTVEGVDIDLTALSSTMIYSEVYNMMYIPEEYVGKTIRMGGAFSAFHDDTTGKDYFACIIQDAAACCAQGIEFSTTD